MTEPINVRVVLDTPGGQVADAAWAADSATLILETAGLGIDVGVLRPGEVRAATPEGDLVTAVRLRAAAAPSRDQPILVIGFAAGELGIPADVKLPDHLLPLKYPNGDGAAPVGWLC